MTEATTVVSILAIVIAIGNIAFNVAMWRQKPSRTSQTAPLDAVLYCPDCPATLAGHGGGRIEHVTDGAHVHHPETLR